MADEAFAGSANHDGKIGEGSGELIELGDQLNVLSECFAKANTRVDNNSTARDSTAFGHGDTATQAMRNVAHYVRDGW